MDRNFGDRRKRSDATGSRHRRWLSALAFAVTAGLILLPVALLAVHDLAFQLDGNIVTSPDGTVGGGNQTIDWEDLFNTDGTTKSSLPSGFGHARLDKDFTSGANNPPRYPLGQLTTNDPTTYATGSKDTLPISGWQCNFDHNVNSKIDIMNSYAATYTAVNGDKILYFGLERNVNSGDANVGFWFLKGNVDCDASAGTGTFTGSHKDGDILIVSAFTGGGSVSEISAYRWCQTPMTSPPDPTCAAAAAADPAKVAAGFLPDVKVAGSGDCRDADHDLNDSICAVANTGTITTPWLTAADKLVTHSLPPALFFEGGINLTKTNLVGCFNEFIGDTRSSQSLTATLFDYAAGALGGCTSDVVSTPTPGPSDTVLIPADGNTAAVNTTDSVVITAHGVSGAWSGTVSFYLCGPYAAATTTTCDGKTGNEGTKIGATKNVSGSGDGSTGSATSDAAKVTSAGRYCWRSDFVHTSPSDLPDGSDSSAGECFTVGPRQPSLATQAQDKDGNNVSGAIPFGQKISDTVSLSNTAHKPGDPVIQVTSTPTDGGDATGNITLRAYGPDSCSTVAYGPVTLAASGDAPPVVGGAGTVFEFTPSSPGKYIFVASYAGDSPNTLGVDAITLDASKPNCGQPATEVVQVQQIPTTIKTKQSWFPNDTALISASTGNLPAGGTVVFTLFTNADCTGAVLYGPETRNVTGGNPTETLSTTNGPANANKYEITTAYSDGVGSSTGTHSWKAVYNTGDSAHTGIQSSCTTDATKGLPETFNITYENDPGPGTNLP